MIRLKPAIEIPAARCPHCRSAMKASDFFVAGMRNLADFRCPNCGGEFCGDLPAGQALYTPVLIDKKSGATFHDGGAPWFAEWLAESYKRRTGEAVKFETRRLKKVKDKVILLNCLDRLYGHCLLKLLNAQHYIDNQREASLIVLIPPFLEWLLPEGVAEAWIVDLPLRRGGEWNDWLAGEIKKRLEQFPEVFLSVAFSHPRGEDFDIERFTGVAPFPLENFAAAPSRPVITFVWREDRFWETNVGAPRGFEKIKRGLGAAQNLRDEQTRKVARLAECLRGKFPPLDFAVAGLGEASPDLPEWITDLRRAAPDAGAERALCERYAASHVVVGVHGSNMLLPSAHAGAVLEIIGAERLGNFLQDILFRPNLSDARETLFRYRFAAHSSSPEDLAQVISTMLRLEDFRRLMGAEFCTHREKYNFRRWLSPRGETRETNDSEKSDVRN